MLTAILTILSWIWRLRDGTQSAFILAGFSLWRRNKQTAGTRDLIWYTIQERVSSGNSFDVITCFSVACIGVYLCCAFKHFVGQFNLICNLSNARALFWFLILFGHILQLYFQGVSPTVTRPPIRSRNMIQVLIKDCD